MFKSESPSQPLSSSPDPREWGYVWGATAPLICTLLVWPLRHWLGPASILMTYLLAVFLVATRYGRGASILASLISAPAFAFYFARPIFSVAIQDLENMVGLGVMIVVANVTGSLLEKSRLQTALATARAQQASALYRLSRDLAAAQNDDAVARTTVEHVRDEFGAAAVLLIADGEGQLHYPAAAPLPSSFRAAELKSAQQALSRRQANCQPLACYYPLESSGSLQGVLAIRPATAFPSTSAEHHTFIDTFCHLIAQTLERLHLAAQARDATLQAESESLRNALLSSISHDLRTPLTRIIGAVTTLLESHACSDSESRELNQLILDEAQRMSELTGKLLDMARLSSGQIVLHRDWNAIEEIVGSALNRLDKHLKARPVRTTLPDHLPLLWIDAVLMEQVVLNLIENAVKYTPPGSPIDISAQLLTDGFRLTVADYGPGIAKSQEKRIFDKFFRGHTETQQNGVGLGLALCQTIVEAHGGSIKAINMTGKGAMFSIELPLHEAPALNQAEAASQ